MVENQGRNIPVPDPTKLTTDAVTSLKEHLTELFNNRFDYAESLTNEKFKGVTQQFTSNDKALDAAFKSAKEVTEKTETNFGKRIQDLTDLFATQMGNLEKDVTDLRLTQRGVTSHGKGVADGWGWIVGGIGIIVGIASVIGVFVSLLHGRT